MRKGQTALEYLMTYGWAILIVIIVVAALYALGLTKPCRWTGTQVSGFAGMTISTVKFQANDGDGDNGLSFRLTNNMPESITITDITMSAPGGYAGSYGGVDVTLAAGEYHDFSGADVIDQTGGTAFAANDCYSVDVTITYDQAGQTGLKAIGKISGLVL